MARQGLKIQGRGSLACICRLFTKAHGNLFLPQNVVNFWLWPPWRETIAYFFLVRALRCFVAAWCRGLLPSCAKRSHCPMSSHRVVGTLASTSLACVSFGAARRWYSKVLIAEHRIQRPFVAGCRAVSMPLQDNLQHSEAMQLLYDAHETPILLDKVITRRLLSTLIAHEH